jgi:hypothetical protein
MRSWGFLSNHGRVLLLLARDPGMRLRDIAARLDITERSAYGIITDLTAARYISKRKDGRRNRYQIEAHQPLPEPASRERTVGEVLAMLTGTGQPPADEDTADPARAAAQMDPGAARHQADRSSST